MSKILHLGTSLKGGGAQSVFRDTVLAFQNQKGIINYVAARSDSEGFSGIRLDCKFTVNKNKWISLLSSIYSLGNMFKLLMFLRKVQPHIIHFHGYGLLSPSILHAMFLYKKLYKAQVKVIQTVHTYELLCSHFAGFDYKINRRCLDCAQDKFMLKIFRRNCSREGVIHSWGKGVTSLIGSFFLNRGVVDDFLFPSEFLLNSVKNSGKFDNTPLNLVRNPINDSFFGEIIDEREASKAKSLVYFGRLSEEKNIECIIKSISIIKNKLKEDCSLTIIGTGEIENDLKQLVNDLGLEANISFVAFLTPPELRKYLASASFSIMASKCFETASLVVVESVLCNLIPIVPRHGAYIEIVDLLECGVFFNSEDPAPPGMHQVERMYTLLARFEDTRLLDGRMHFRIALASGEVVYAISESALRTLPPQELERRLQEEAGRLIARMLMETIRPGSRPVRTIWTDR